MITQNKILDALNLVLVDKLPTYAPVYRDACPLNFVRPSAFLYAEPREMTDVNAFLVEHKQKFTIWVYDAVDAHYEAQTDPLNEAVDTLMLAVDCGYLRVCDRALHLTACQSGRDGAAAFVTVEYNWLEDRGREESTAPTAGTVCIASTVQNDGSTMTTTENTED